MDSLKMRTDIAFEDLKVLAVLGTGTFGRVKLVQYEKDTFALKIMQKARWLSIASKKMSCMRRTSWWRRAIRSSSN